MRCIKNGSRHMGRKKPKKPECPECGSVVVEFLSLRHNWKPDSADTDKSESTDYKWRCEKCGHLFDTRIWN
jgi:ribosomal protein S27AE